jgi:hypothetical protein
MGRNIKVKKFNEFLKINEEVSTDWQIWKKGQKAPIIPKELYANENTSNIMYADALDKAYKEKKTDFLKKLVWIAKQFNIPVNWLMGMLFIESGGAFNNITTKRDKPGENGAYGIWQLTQGTFNGTFGKGVNSDYLGSDPLRQLDYLYYYLKLYKVQERIDPIQVYLVVFQPGRKLPMDTLFPSDTCHGGNANLFARLKNPKLRCSMIDFYVGIITKKEIFKQLYLNGDFDKNTDFTSSLKKHNIDLEKLLNGKKRDTQLVTEPEKPTPANSNPSSFWEEIEKLANSTLEFFKKLNVGMYP